MYSGICSNIFVQKRKKWIPCFPYHMLKKHTFSLHPPIRVKIRSVTEPKEHFYKIHLKFKEKSLIIDLAQNQGLQLKITQGRHSGYSVAKSHLTLHDPMKHASLPCSLPSLGVFTSSCPLNQCYHPTVSSSVALFSFY